MNKVSSWMLLICLIMLLTACKSEETKAVEETISDIGSVTEESYFLIQEARVAYEQLSEKDKKTVSNISNLEKAELAYNAILANEVDALIAKIGPINDESKAEIDFARTEYDKLTNVQASLVANFGELLDAEEAYDTYIVNRAIGALNALQNIAPEDAEGIEDAEYIYKKLSDKQKSQVTEEVGNVHELLQNTKVEIVNQLIARITYTKNEPSVDDLMTMMNAIRIFTELEETAQSHVEKYKTLEKAINGYITYRDKRAKTDELYMRQEYMNQCQSIAFDELILYPKSYKGQQLAIEIEVLDIEKGLLMMQDRLAAVMIGREDVLELKDGRKVGEPIIAVGDTFTVYGTFEGTTTMTVKEDGSGLFGTKFLEKVKEKYEIPVVEIVYTSIDNNGVIAEGNPNAKDVGLDKEAEDLKYQLDELIEQMQ